MAAVGHQMPTTPSLAKGPKAKAWQRGVAMAHDPTSMAQAITPCRPEPLSAAMDENLDGGGGGGGGSSSAGRKCEGGSSDPAERVRERP